MTSDDPELLSVQIFWEFHEISQIWKEQQIKE